MGSCELGESSRTILEAIAEGRSYEQILSTGLAATYHDIFRAAAEAHRGQTFHTKFAMPGRYGKEESMPRGRKLHLKSGRPVCYDRAVDERG